MMPGVDILGCFFHLAKAFKKKVDKKNMKKHYDENPEFWKFIKQAVGLSSLPLGDLEIGVKWLRDNVNFEDEEEALFKEYFMEYIDSYWVNGVFPPFVWSTWKRTGDYTNNNQEGFNSKINRELMQVHPSPGILLCFIRKQIILAEHKMCEAIIGEPKPRQQLKHRQNKKKRTNLKKNFEKAKQLKNVDIIKLVGEYLSVMGHNVISSTLVGRSTDLSNSQDPNHIIDDESNDASFWQVLDETLEEEMDEGDNPYAGRKVGVSKKVQERNANQWWKGAICPSCNHGFNSKSAKKQCHSCDKYTHVKTKCVTMAEDNLVFLCRSCKPGPIMSDNNDVLPAQDGFTCTACHFKTSFKYNLKRHMERHKNEINQAEENVIEGTEPAEAMNSVQEPTTTVSITLKTVLDEAGVGGLFHKFSSEGIDMELLLDLNRDDFRRMLEDLDIN